MINPPVTIGNAPLLFYVTLHHRHYHTGNTTHYVEGRLLGAVPALAICQYQDNSGYYLFRCDAQWTPLADTYHDTIEEAMEQATFEYEGLTSSDWRQYQA